jgi:hypothetical protein
LSLTSCSGVQKISQRATNIVDVASSSQKRFETIGEEARKTTDMDRSLIVSEATAGVKEQKTIIDNVNDIITTLPQVEDSVPWWATLVQYGFIATSIIGVLVLLWYLGLGYPIKALMRNFSSLIPSSKRSAAKLLVKANDPESETTTRELIAVLRATDPDFNAAYQKEKQK